MRKKTSINIKVEVKSVCEQTVCLYFELQYFLKHEVLHEHLTLLRFATRLSESEQECMFDQNFHLANF